MHWTKLSNAFFRCSEQKSFNSDWKNNDLKGVEPDWPGGGINCADRRHAQRGLFWQTVGG